MYSLYDRFATFTKIGFVVLLVLVGMGMTATGANEGNGVSCQTLTDNPSVNRAICALDPRPLLNKPVGEILPFLAAN